MRRWEIVNQVTGDIVGYRFTRLGAKWATRNSLHNGLDFIHIANSDSSWVQVDTWGMINR